MDAEKKVIGLRDTGEVEGSRLTLRLPYTRFIICIVPTKERLLRIRRLSQDVCEIEASIADVSDDLERGIAHGLLVDHIFPATMDHEDPLVEDLKVRILRTWIAEEVRLLFKEYRGMTLNLRILPDFFLFRHYKRKGRLLFMLKAHYAQLLERALEVVRERPSVMRKALAIAEREGLMSLEGNLIKIMKEPERPISRLISLPVKLQLSQESLSVQAFSLTLLSYAAKVALRANAAVEGPNTQEDRLIFIETDQGLKPLDTRFELWRRMKEKGFKLRRLGGVLNTAYLLEREDGELLVVKIFQEWTNFKWLPLAFWALGAYTFDPTGRGRLINEYSMNREFRKHGLPVPDIYHVDLANKLIVEEYIEGTTLRELILKILRARLEDVQEDLELLRRALKAVALVHSKGFVLGDANPTNIILHRNNVFFVDLEQARKGNKYSWDLATLFFFTAHYVQGLSLRRLEQVIEAMVEGYLEEGEAEIVKGALKVPYLRVYAFFAYPHAIFKLYRCVSKLLG